MGSLCNKVWNYKKIDEAKAGDIKNKLDISTFLARVLSTLPIDNISNISSFLKPKLDYFHDPFLLNDMGISVDRIMKALENKEKIVIFGDYDVDGITSTSLLYDFFKGIGANIDYYIPNRINEGYGISMKALENVLAKKPSLIVTVDCGITSIDEVSYITSKGIDIIITDHHTCGDVLPKAYGVINPVRKDSTYPFRYLAGVGVAYKLVMALCDKLGMKDFYLKYLDIVALGTVADVVNLTDENRVIVRYGLKKMMKAPNMGIDKLLCVSGLKNKKLNTRSLGFGLAPRLNAAGRLSDAKKGVLLLTTEDEKKALEIAVSLDEENKLRQQKEHEILDEALKKIENNNLDKDKIIVVAGENWNKGIIGIVASKITDKFYKPCIVLTITDGIADGSARSINKFNILNAVNSCKDILLKYGGHEMAAGLALNADRVEELRKKLNEYADVHLREEDMCDTIDITMELENNEITLDNAKRLEHLKPFGAGNPVPIFVCHNIKVSNITRIGNDKHIRLSLGDKKVAQVDAVGFNMGDLINKIDINNKIDVAFEFNRNIWNGTENVQMIIKDLQIIN